MTRNTGIRRWESMKHYVKWETWVGGLTRALVTLIGWGLMRMSRRLFRWSLGRCVVCGRQPGFDSAITRQGKLCFKCWCRVDHEGSLPGERTMKEGKA